MKTYSPINAFRIVLGILWITPALVLGADGNTATTQAEAGKIEGIAIARTNGGYLGLAIVGGNFKLSFYDAKKQPVPVDVSRASARWNPKQKSGHAYNILNPTADGMALEGNRFVSPPYTYLVILSLINEAGDVVEAYSVKMSP